MAGTISAVKLIAIDFKKKSNHKMLQTIEIWFVALSVCRMVTDVKDLLKVHKQ